MARKKLPPISAADKRVIGALLREVRRAAGYRSVDRVAELPGCPASRQTIYAYERGSLVPTLRQFLDLVGFLVLDAPAPQGPSSERKLESDLRALGVAAVARALTLRAFHVVDAHDLIARMQPEIGVSA